MPSNPNAIGEVAIDRNENVFSIENKSLPEDIEKVVGKVRLFITDVFSKIAAFIKVVFTGQFKNFYEKTNANLGWRS